MMQRKSQLAAGKITTVSLEADTLFQCIKCSDWCFAAVRRWVSPFSPFFIPPHVFFFALLDSC